MHLRLAITLAVAAICSFAATADNEPPPIAAFATLPEVEGITISPTGRYLTASIRQGDGAQFQIIAHPTGRLR